MKIKMKRLILLGLGTTFIMIGCTDSGETGDTSDTGSNVEVVEEDNMEEAMPEMDHDGEIPMGLQEAQDPMFPEGSNATITATHMPGMEGAEATIAGAFDTTVYEVSYTPTTGGERVTNHRWVIQEDLEEGADVAEVGDEVILNAEHMEGMQGASAVVEEVYTGTIYAVDYESTTDGQKVTNHMWVTEEELEDQEE